MIVGKGLIASLFIANDRENTVFFASGVSNSLETRVEEFLREENLIKNTITENPDKIFVYFSTCSIYDSSKTGSDYVLHKLKMEQLIKKSCKQFLILRVSNAVGKGGNPNLLMNYIVRAVKNDETINVHTKATRNLIDVDDIRHVTFDLLKNQSLNKIINVAYLKNYSIVEILEIVEKFYDKKINSNLLKSGSGYDINIPDIESYFTENNLINKETYLLGILKKYYAVM
ncbi:sugar nucleotide-binding protein [Chryseobacterium sp. Ch-15]|uniref:NAD-dependent epimerase/dehydratase family protein n=1 Tax=Chryseobacterium muglaense TaxID=2893752 RepID=A0A9Q3UWT5_9FLAO|nr:NAD-dependent epimerase/dehydratase family protein [Chryseobacterium muglaense]MBD3903832.1 NAD-dependent epimerase/dehydratase family protein [Chryseobacterium muglaense]MCC9034906.1 sugar nucleotide-binding protein [Chryseobacterium muglaense]MCM2553171.1 sugar nucleotide-binding protein [Chryseobacterium muglaense]